MKQHYCNFLMSTSFVPSQSLFALWYGTFDCSSQKHLTSGSWLRQVAPKIRTWVRTGLVTKTWLAVLQYYASHLNKLSLLVEDRIHGFPLHFSAHAVFPFLVRKQVNANVGVRAVGVTGEQAPSKQCYRTYHFNLATASVVLFPSKKTQLKTSNETSFGSSKC